MLGVRRHHGAQIDLFQGDLTAFACDAMLNAADTRLSGGGGVDAAIHRVGGPALQAACRQLGSCPVGSAVATPAGGLPARYVIHATGPRWQGGGHGEAADLAAAYQAGLLLADGLGLRHVACAALSTGAFGYPVDEAALVAMAAAKVFCAGQRQATARLTFVLHGPETYLAFREALAAAFPEA